MFRGVAFLVNGNMAIPASGQRVSGYLIGSRAGGKLPLPPEAELQWWYQY